MKKAKAVQRGLQGVCDHKVDSREPRLWDRYWNSLGRFRKDVLELRWGLSHSSSLLGLYSGHCGGGGHIHCNGQ